MAPCTSDSLFGLGKIDLLLYGAYPDHCRSTNRKPATDENGICSSFFSILGDWDEWTTWVASGYKQFTFEFPHQFCRMDEKRPRIPIEALESLVTDQISLPNWPACWTKFPRSGKRPIQISENSYDIITTGFGTLEKVEKLSQLGYSIIICRAKGLPLVSNGFTSVRRCEDFTQFKENLAKSVFIIFLGSIGCWSNCFPSDNVRAQLEGEIMMGNNQQCT